MLLLTLVTHPFTFLGVTNNTGKKLQANSVLLWEAIIHSKYLGCKWFDIGGLSEETPKGIADFKKRFEF